MCNCRKRASQQYTWTAADGSVSIVYSTEIQAKAKVMRAGGTYAPTAQANVSTP